MKRKRRFVCADLAISLPTEDLPSKLLLFGLALLVYANSRDGDFVFDDSEAIVRNADVNLKVGNGQQSDSELYRILKVFQHDFWGDSIRSNTSHKSYRPLTVLTFRYSIFCKIIRIKS